MGEISLEASEVSRFVASLSKSIQALCHGCMDFDDSIEMIGYININIDSGKTVDCVLNEKVRKSSANAMSFMSNSFHAKKEKPKQMKDGSCSPIPELSHPISSHKRSYMSDHSASYGIPRKRHRYHARPPVSSYPEQYSTLDTTLYQQPDPSNTTFPDQSSTSSDPTNQSLPVVKAETETNYEFDESGPSTSDNFLVKQENSELPAPESQDMQQDSHYNSMLEPSTANSSGQLHDTAKDSDNSNFQEQPETTGQFGNDPVEQESIYYDTAESSQTNDQQPQGSLEDTGDDSQFEVIEIGDDDEDVGSLFDPTEDNSSIEKDWMAARPSGNAIDHPYSYPPSSEDFSCPSCPTKCIDRFRYRHHMERYHPLPFSCRPCDKTFLTRAGLKRHLSSRFHADSKFACSVCDKGFYYACSLKLHLKNIHKCMMCRKCKIVFRIWEFQKHEMSCNGRTA